MLKDSILRQQQAIFTRRRTNMILMVRYANILVSNRGDKERGREGGGSEGKNGGRKRERGRREEGVRERNGGRKRERGTDERRKRLREGEGGVAY